MPCGFKEDIISLLSNKLHPYHLGLVYSAQNDRALFMLISHSTLTSSFSNITPAITRQVPFNFDLGFLVVNFIKIVLVIFIFLKLMLVILIYFNKDNASYFYFLKVNACHFNKDNGKVKTILAIGFDKQ